jgi:hypothetical protein
MPLNHAPPLNVWLTTTWQQLQWYNCQFYITILIHPYSIPYPYEQYQADKGVLIVEWGQFQPLHQNHKPPKNKFLILNKKTLTLNLRNKINNKMQVLRTILISF